MELEKVQNINIEKINNIKISLELLKKAYDEVLVENVDYGRIPGTDKPTLLKAGAEKLLLLFGYTSKTNVEVKLLENNHREYISTTEIFDKSGKIISTGVGSCSTLEKKYRYRKEKKYLGEIPKDYKIRKNEYKLQGKEAIKTENGWGFYELIYVENPDIADVYNTCLKMSAKRSFVDATIKSTMAGMLFTQDLEDYTDISTIVNSNQQNNNNNEKEKEKENENNSDIQTSEELMTNEVKLEEMKEKIYNAFSSGKSKNELFSSLVKKKQKNEVTLEEYYILEDFINSL